MPKITFLPSNRVVEYDAGSLPRREGRAGCLLDAALHYGIELRHLCAGFCACTTCHVLIEKGLENLSAMEPDEDDRLHRNADYSPHSRLACRAVPSGDVTVRVPGGGEGS